MNKAYIGIGSNLQNRLANIETAIAKVDESAQCKVQDVSSIYETKPFGITEQNNFYNAAIKIETEIEPKELLHLLKDIEKEMGRKKIVKWGPRIIDLDILLYDDIILNDEELSIPHKEIINRDFVLVPLQEIAPDKIHPVIKKRLSEICILEGQTYILRKLPDGVLLNE